jgi:cytoskeletal protein CcmA (bactofilin family)
MSSSNFRPTEQSRMDVAHIGKSVYVKGELSGSEDLYVDGEVEGTIALDGHRLTVGPEGRIRAGIQAKDVIIQGKVDGDVVGAQRVELRKTAHLMGNIRTLRIAIEEGAVFKGHIEMLQEMKEEPNKTAASRASQAATAASQPAVPAAPAPTQGSLLDKP